MRRVLFHIGVGKTATSTIQANLLANHELLLAANTLLPVIESPHRPFNGNHSAAFTTMFSERALFLEENIADGINDEESLDRRREDYFAQIARQLEASDAAQVLFSCEATTNFSPEARDRIYTWLRDHFDEVTSIACLRHPASLLSSDIQQRVKVGFVIEDVLASSPVLRYDFLLAQVDRLSDRLIAYDFDAATKHGVTEYFLDSIGIGHDDWVIAADRSNPALSGPAVQLLSALNRLRPLKSEGQWGPQRFLDDRVAFFALPGEPFRLPPTILEQFAPEIDAQVEWVREHLDVTMSPGAVRGSHPELDPELVDALALTISNLQNRARIAELTGELTGTGPEDRDLVAEISRLRGTA